MSTSIWSQQLLFLLPFLIFAAVLSIKPPREHTLGGKWLELYPALYHSRWGITLIQISALSSEIYMFILPPIWLSS